MSNAELCFVFKILPDLKGREECVKADTFLVTAAGMLFGFRKQRCICSCPGTWGVC